MLSLDTLRLYPQQFVFPTPWVCILLTARYPVLDKKNKYKTSVIFLGFINYRSIHTFTCIFNKDNELPSRILFPWRFWRDFLDAPLACEEFCTPKLHTLDHIKRESEVHRKREKVHTHNSALIFRCCLDRSLRLAKKKPSRNR